MGPRGVGGGKCFCRPWTLPRGSSDDHVIRIKVLERSVVHRIAKVAVYSHVILFAYPDPDAVILDEEIAFEGLADKYGICSIGSAVYHCFSKFNGMSVGVQEGWDDDRVGFVEALMGGGVWAGAFEIRGLGGGGGGGGSFFFPAGAGD